MTEASTRGPKGNGPEPSSDDPTVDEAPPWNYADEPLQTMADDKLDHARLATYVTKALQALSSRQASSVVALVGPWGSGKTSLLNTVQQELRDDGWATAEYNPWSYPALDVAIAGFFQELQSALPKGALQDTKRQTLGKLGQRLAPFGAVAGVVGVDGEGMVRAASGWLAGDESPETLRRQAEAQLRLLDQPILVTVDDLDRLGPDELLLTFRLVRLLGRLPNVFYLLSYDEETLEDILQRTGLVGQDPGRARAYLEKMVQVRMPVPPMLPVHQLALFNAGLSDLQSQYHLVLDDVAVRTLSRAWNEGLQKLLNQPRAIKKLFSQVAVAWPSVQNEVDFADFLLITYLQTFEPRLVRHLNKSRAELTRVPASTLMSSRSPEETHQERWQRWTREVERLAVGEADAVMHLLAELYLPLKGARDNTTYSRQSYTELQQRRRAGANEYFDRYMQGGVTGDDIPDAVIREAFSPDGSVAGPQMARLASGMENDASALLPKLQRAHSAGELPSGRLFEVASEYYLTAMSQKSGPLGLSPDFGLLSLAIDCLNALPLDDAVEAIRSAIESESGLVLALEACDRASQQSGRVDQELPVWVESARDVITAAAETFFRRAAQAPLQENTRTLALILWRLVNLRGREAVQAMVWDIIDGPGPWDVYTLLVIVVPVGTMSSDEGTWEALGELQQSSLDTIFGMDRLLASVPVTSEGHPTLDSWDRRRVEPTIEAKLAYALSVLAAAKEHSTPESPEALEADGDLSSTQSESAQAPIPPLKSATNVDP